MTRRLAAATTSLSLTFLFALSLIPFGATPLNVTVYVIGLFGVHGLLGGRP